MNLRQELILKLINEREVKTQEELGVLLNENGVSVTQATLSRDIKTLMLTKTRTASGGTKYTAGAASGGAFLGSVISAQSAENIVVIKTSSAAAPVVAAAVDAMENPLILGTIAGDDTVMAVAASSEAARDFAETLKNLI